MEGSIRQNEGIPVFYLQVEGFIFKNWLSFLAVVFLNLHFQTFNLMCVCVCVCVFFFFGGDTSID